jgi:hypothetical protein
MNYINRRPYILENILVPRISSECVIRTNEHSSNSETGMIHQNLTKSNLLEFDKLNLADEIFMLNKI